MEIKDEGICRFCLKTYAGRSMGRHLTACKAKKAHDAAAPKGRRRLQPVYHLKISGYKPFWLHIEMPATATLRDLDSFLRRIWLECCGHLSEFRIQGVHYSIDADMPDFGDFGFDNKSMDIALNTVLRVKDTFDYEYDFGSTTSLRGQVYAEREGVLQDVRILARNTMPEVPCSDCPKPATTFCAECYALYCGECFATHGCDEEMALPVVNSPRMGVCAYYGDDGFDPFDPQAIP